MPKRRPAKRDSHKTKKQQWIPMRKVGKDGKPMTIYVRDREHFKVMLRDDRLYEKYAKPLEANHKGEFVAIGLSGEMIMGKEMDQVFFPALQRFGSQNFALERFGYEELLTIR